MTARWETPTDDQVAAWQAWVAERPPAVRDVAERLNPWDMYRLTTTGQRCRILSFGEVVTDDGAPTGEVTVTIYAEHRDLGAVSGRQVFGIKPEELVPWA